MKRHVVIVTKFVFGVLPSVGGALFALFGITRMVEAQLAPSKIFGRSPLTFEHLLVFILLVCVTVGGGACGVAWLKEWRRNEERNGSLIAGLIVALVGVAGIAAWAGYVRAGVWPLIGIPAFIVLLTLLRRECSLTR
jgi:hypothetical protein